MSETRLLEWSRIFRERLDRRVFEGTSVDSEFDETFRDLEEEICEHIAAKINAEFTSTNVNLSDENIRGLAAAIVGASLQKSPCLNLNLSKNRLRWQDLTYIVKTITSKQSKLQVLNLSNNRIEDKGARLIAEMLKENESLKSLNLDTNSIGSGIEEIAKSLSRNTSLVKFSVNWNALGVFADEFYLALMKNRTLQNVEMGYCTLTNVFADSISTALVQNKTLKNLILFGNQITDDGALSLAEAVEVNKTLLYLNLKNNLITNKGTDLFIEVLKDKESFGQRFSVNLKQNKVSHPKLCELESLTCQKQRQLTQIEVEPDSISDDETDTESVKKRHDTEALFYNNRFYNFDPDAYNIDEDDEDDEDENEEYDDEYYDEESE